MTADLHLTGANVTTESHPASLSRRYTMFPVLLIVIGIVVLVLGKRLAVLGAAVGALLGVGLLRLLNRPRLPDLLHAAHSRSCSR